MKQLLLYYVILVFVSYLCKHFVSPQYYKYFTNAQQQLFYEIQIKYFVTIYQDLFKVKNYNEFKKKRLTKFVHVRVVI